MPKGWTRLNAYAIRKYPWIIAKVFVDGATLYILSDDAGVRYGHFESAAEAVSESDRLELGAQA
jgi:hypothetical protein